MGVSKLELRRLLDLRTERRPEAGGFWSEEPTQHSPCAPGVAGRSRQLFFCTPCQGDLGLRAGGSCRWQGASPGGCRNRGHGCSQSKGQQEGGHLQASAPLCLSPDFTVLPLLAPGFQHPHLHALLYPWSAPGCSEPWRPMIGIGRKNIGKKGKVLYLCTTEIRFQVSFR